MGKSYNEKDITSIFEHSKGLLNHCLRDFMPNAAENAGKGSLGQLVEKLYFGYNTNSRQEADFSIAGVELKCTPLKKSFDKRNLLIKERLVCCMINYAEDWNKTFEQSHFYQKCLVMLLMFYLHQSGVSKLDLEFLFTVLWKIPEKDLLIIRQDYEVIISKIKNGEAHTLSEGDTMYLGACRKGQKGDTLMVQHGNSIRAPRRAWSLKAAYMRRVLEEILEYNENGAYCNFVLPKLNDNALFSTDELKEKSIDEILLNRFSKFQGKTYNEISKILKINPITSKSKYFVLSNAIASKRKVGNINKAEEFIKSGLTMKTIRVNKHGTIKESMSFENIDYQEILDCNEWTESRLYELFSNRFLFVVYKETDSILSLPKGRKEAEYQLDKVGFWTMSQNDLKIAKSYWQNIRECVKENHIDPNYFWNIESDRNFHVRPKAAVATDLAVNPNGGMTKKYCYWFNAKYVKKIIENEL